MHTSGRKSGRRHFWWLAVCVAMLAGMAAFSGCHRQVAAGQTSGISGPDPADANMAPVDDADQQQAAVQPPAQGQNVQNESQQRADEYRRTGAQAGAPTDQPNDQQNDQQDQQQDQAYGQNNGQTDQSYANDQNYDDQVDAGQQAIEEADQPPPPLPVYVQPEAPGPNYIWTPGYWSYAPIGYYWVPGAWVAAPYYGALWTPGYWAFYGNRYRFYRGYWGLHIGFYGGIHYGFGYTGIGYHGGYWNGDNFYYNRAVNRINVTRITNIYNRPVIVNNYTRVAFNGGRGGIQARPNRSELVAMRAPRIPPMTTQLRMRQEAAQNRQQFFNQNKGRPAMAVTSRPLVADRGIQRPVARPMPARPEVRPGQPNQVRPGQFQNRPGQTGQQNRPEIRPNQPQVRPVQPNPQIRPSQPGMRPGRPAIQPDQPQIRPSQPESRPIQPQVRPVQPNRPSQARPEQQMRPQQQRGPTPQPRPQSEFRPQEQHPQPQIQSRPENRSQPQPRMAEPSRPQVREAPRNENRQPR